jgi:Tol biopolymer transport system component
LAPDGTRAAVSRLDAQSQNRVVWLLDFSRGTSTRFTFGSGNALDAIWSPDGNTIAFASNREGPFDLYQKPASGATDEALLLKSDEDKVPSSWSRDGRFLLYTSSGPKTKGDLWVLALAGDKKPFPFLQTEFNERNGQFSPDGRWVAYSSDESGRPEVYVRPFSSDSKGSAFPAGGKWLVSTGGGTEPRWKRDGKELYYIASDGKLMAVEITANSAFQPGAPKALFQAPPLVSTPNAISQWDLTADGKRFIFEALTAQSAQTSFTVVLNWQAALEK